MNNCVHCQPKGDGLNKPWYWIIRGHDVDVDVDDEAKAFFNSVDEVVEGLFHCDQSVALSSTLILLVLLTYSTELWRGGTLEQFDSSTRWTDRARPDSRNLIVTRRRSEVTRPLKSDVQRWRAHEVGSIHVKFTLLPASTLTVHVVTSLLHLRSPRGNSAR